MLPGEPCARIQMLGLGFRVSRDFSITTDSLSHRNHDCHERHVVDVHLCFRRFMVYTCTRVSERYGVYMQE